MSVAESEGKTCRKNGVMNLRGRWILITGASSGLGHAIGRVMARDYGAHLILAARRIEKLDELANEVTSSYGVQAVVCRTDLTKPNDVARLSQFFKSFKIDGVQTEVRAGKNVEVPIGGRQSSRLAPWRVRTGAGHHGSRLDVGLARSWLGPPRRR